MKVPKNILLFDSQLVVRKGIESILFEKLSNITLYNCASYAELEKILHSITIHIIILDSNINGIENIRLIDEIKKHQPEIKILIFTSQDEKMYGLRYIKHGADGFLNKYCSEETFVKAIQCIVKDGFYYSNELKKSLQKKNFKVLSALPIDDLSTREYEISRMLVSGLGNLEIANKLDIKMSTVSTYKNRVFGKLNINNVVALSELFKE